MDKGRSLRYLPWHCLKYAQTFTHYSFRIRHFPEVNNKHRNAAPVCSDSKENVKTMFMDQWQSLYLRLAKTLPTNVAFCTCWPPSSKNHDDRQNWKVLMYKIFKHWECLERFWGRCSDVFCKPLWQKTKFIKIFQTITLCLKSSWRDSKFPQIKSLCQLQFGNLWQLCIARSNSKQDRPKIEIFEFSLFSVGQGMLWKD